MTHVPIVSCTPNPCMNGGTCFQLGTTVICTCTSSLTGERCEIRMDDQPPVIGTCPPTQNSALTTGQTQTAVTFTQPSCSDDRSVSPAVSCLPPSGSLFGAGDSVVSCACTDNIGQTDGCNLIVSVAEAAEPFISLTCPASQNRVLLAGQTRVAAVWTVPTCTGVPNGDFLAQCSHVSGSLFLPGTSQITCNCVLSGAVIKTCDFTISVTSTANQPPVIGACPSDEQRTVSTPQSQIPVTFTLPICTDDLGSATVTCSPQSGSMFVFGNNVVTCSCRDNIGQIDTCSFTISVTTTPSDQSPTIGACPGNQQRTVATPSSQIAVTFSLPLCADDLTASPAVSCSPGSGTSFGVGTQSVTCTCSDSIGQTDTCFFTVSVTSGPDNEPPVPSCPGDVEVNVLLGGSARATWEEPTVTDNSGGLIIVTSTSTSGSVFEFGRTVIMYVFTDPSGNTATCSFFVTVDGGDLAICCPFDIDETVPAGSGGRTIAYSLACPPVDLEGITIISQLPPPDSFFDLGTTEVVMVLVDELGNTDQCEFVVTLREDVDNVAPIITCPPDQNQVLPTSQTTVPANYPAAICTDNVAVNPTVLCTVNPGMPLGVGVRSVTCFCFDTVSLSSQCLFDINVTEMPINDVIPPVIGACPNVLPVNAPAGQNQASVTWTDPTCTDNLDTSPSVRCTPPSRSDFMINSTSVQCTCTDDVGLSSSCSFTVVVDEIVDEEIPRIQCPANQNGVGNPSSVTWLNPTCIDNVDPNPTVSCSRISGSQFFLGTTDVTCTCVDFVGLQAQCIFVVTVRDEQVVDNTAPILDACPTSQTIQVPAGEPGSAADWRNPSCNDPEDPNPTVRCIPSSGSTFPLTASTVGCSCTNAVGLSDFCSFTVTVESIGPDTPPEASCPEDVSILIEGTSSSATWPSALCSDDRDVNLVPSCTRNSGDTFPLGVTPVNCICTDTAGNTDMCTFNVRIRSNADQVPVIRLCPGNQQRTVPTPSSQIAVNFNRPSCTDDLTASPAVSCSPGSGTSFGVGTQSVTCTCSDSIGQTDTCSFTVSVTSTTDQSPNIGTCPDNEQRTVATLSSQIAVTFNLPLCTDDLSASPAVSCSPGSGTSFSVGTRSVTCTCIDNIGQTDFCSFTVSVTVPGDNIVPVFVNCPTTPVTADVMGAGQTGTIVTFLSPVATDDSGVVTVTCDPPSGNFFPIGTTSVICAAVDASGNQANCPFSVIVSSDITAPVIGVCPTTQEISTNPGSAQGTPSWINPNCFDTMDSSPQVTCQPIGSFNVGTTSVTCTCIDSAGLTDTCLFSVTVNDNENPLIDNCPTLLNEIMPPGQALMPVFWPLPTCNDNADFNPSITCDPASGTVFPSGESQVICVCTDAAGNSNLCQFQVNIVPSAPPSISCPPNREVDTIPGSRQGLLTYNTPTCIDNSNTNLAVTCTPMSGTFIDMGETTVTCSCTDSSNLSNRCEFVLIVQDMEQPLLTCPPIISITTSPGLNQAVATWNPPICNDFVNDNPVVQCSFASGSSFGIGPTQVTCTCSDGATVAVTCSFFVIVADNEQPTISCPPDMTVAMAIGAAQAPVTYDPPTCADNADSNPTISCNPASGTLFPNGPTVVRCTCTDAAQLSSTCTFTVTIIDDQRPSIICPAAPAPVNTPPQQSSALVTYGNPSCTDNSPVGLQIVCAPPSSSVFSLGTTSVTCTCADAGGLEDTCSFGVIVVVDIDPPVISGCPQDMQLSTPGTSAIVQWIEPTATDNSGTASLLSRSHEFGSAFPVGTTRVTYHFSDPSGNIAACSFNVVVTRGGGDNQPPVIQNVPQDITLAFPSGVTSVQVFWVEPRATDNAGVATLQSRTATPGDTFTTGQTEVRYVFVDTSGNTASASFTISAQPFGDLGLSFFNIPDLPIEGSAPPGATTATVTWMNFLVLFENRLMNPVSQSHMPGDSFPIGITAVLYTYDLNGQTISLVLPVVVSGGRRKKRDIQVNIAIPTVILADTINDNNN